MADYSFGQWDVWVYPHHPSVIVWAKDRGHQRYKIRKQNALKLIAMLRMDCGAHAFSMELRKMIRHPKRSGKT